MKKLALISLLCIYSLSILGISFKEFYCCGKLKSLSISISHNSVTHETTDRGCCKTLYKSFKIKDDHVGSNEVKAPSSDFADLLPNLPLSQIVLPDQNLDKVADVPDPPRYRNIPSYILNCFFRI